MELEPGTILKIPIVKSDLTRTRIFPKSICYRVMYGMGRYRQLSPDTLSLTHVCVHVVQEFISGGQDLFLILSKNTKPIEFDLMARGCHGRATMKVVYMKSRGQHPFLPKY